MLLNRKNSGERWRIRPDGRDKVTGAMKYLTDMALPGMLTGLVLRSPYPHAAILGIRVDQARKLPGVHAVLTHLDVPGLNAYGIAIQDQPVFCYDRVRYVGDAVAAVAAETLEQAERALAAIEVDYEQLPVLDSPEKALENDADQLHPHGNVLHRNAYKTGDVERAFENCAHIVEETYSTPRQMHTYMETEGGLFVPGTDRLLNVYAPTQHGFMDRLQLSRILAVPQGDIRIVSSPIGGSFGGKDELNVQPYGALLAMKTGRPVRIHNSRWESVRVGLKRHPMVITMRTGADADGRLIAHQVRVTADTGPYATLGAEVLNFATEHVTGPYQYANVDVESMSVFTNNGMSGEFRGFGGNQAIFALEGQMDRLAECLGMDPWEFRKLNLREAGDPGPFGQPIARTDGARQVWKSLQESRLWKEREAALERRPGAACVPAGNPSTGPSDDGHSADSKSPWLKEGIGAAYVMHGAGLGVGIPDPAGGRLQLARDGRIEAVFGYEEFGQGLIATLELMLIETFGLAPEDIRIRIGDTDVVPDSGSSTASRATSMMWKSVQNMRMPFMTALLEAAGRLLHRNPGQLHMGRGGIYGRADGEGEGRKLLLPYQALAASTDEPLMAETRFSYPASPVDRVGAHFLYTYAAVAVKVEVNTLTGRVRVVDQFHTVAAGPVMNPQGYLGQIEGGSSMALGFTLTEDAVMTGGCYLTRNLDTYLVPTIAEHMGRIDVLPIEELPPGDPHGPRGIGEIGSVGLAPAVAAAVRQAVGRWVCKLPIDPAELQERPHFTQKAVAVHE
ncbi:xanthine dehydrogenase subunit D [Paenibacillus sambharensis]|uniref:Xanthine dehydrogenase subunit D n=1 Tax=Paenibacillus sambharensis TaxID=1803190 RepID=A0A2W1LNN5_9BACL|nr:xanthine dehydrogenase subunit D [Paenibacillus sambharensis]PZD96094.1 xanthine dehydrogenase subunit D [Paenibacillus sambharensis]